MRKIASAAALAVVASLGLTAPLASTAAEGDGQSFTKVEADSKITLGEGTGEFGLGPDVPIWVDPPRDGGGDFNAAYSVTTPPAPYPGSETFNLNSRPGASKTIYLDFVGGSEPQNVLSGVFNRNGGNNYETGSFPEFVWPAWTLDTDRATFNTNERRVIQLAWSGVAEAFASFDVNVTTAPQNDTRMLKQTDTDQEYGVSVLFYDNAYENDGAECGCGGLSAGSNDTPVNYPPLGNQVAPDSYFDFQNEVVTFASPGAGIGTWSNMAGTAAHEAGHWFGLDHHGDTRDPQALQDQGLSYSDGNELWAPIMGSGGPAIAQWSRGEYPFANNTQNDVAILNSQIGVPADDHGNNAGAATAVGYGFAYGQIDARADRDVFRIVHGGTRTVTIRTNAHMPILDTLLQIRDKDGVLVAQNDPQSNTNAPGQGAVGPPPVGMGASVTFNTVASRAPYYAYVDGTGRDGSGFNNYSDYSSLGRYNLQLQ